MERRFFQIIIGLLSLVPILGAVTAFGQGGAYFFPAGAEVPVDLDNQYRYLAGTYLSVTFAIWWTLGNIEERVAAIRIVCAGIFIGGLGRVWSMVTVGMPDSPEFVAGIVIEVVLVPLLLLWQMRLRGKMGVT